MVSRLGHWCDVRDTSAYAVHTRAYGVFTAFLHRLRSKPAWLREGANHVPAIDNWIPHALPVVYALPTLVSQPFAVNDSQGATAMMRQTSARQYARWCAQGGEEAKRKGERARGDEERVVGGREEGAKGREEGGTGAGAKAVGGWRRSKAERKVEEGFAKTGTSGRRRGKPMKLSSFATRHIYLMKDQE
jgi:hypothetical protein